MRGEEVVDDDVGTPHQLAGKRSIRRVAQVERHRLLVAVDGEKVGADSVQERRTPPPGLVATSRLLDLDDAGAGVREQLRAEWSREHAGEIGDEDALEWKRAHRYVDFRASRSASVFRRIATTLWISLPYVFISASQSVIE